MSVLALVARAYAAFLARRARARLRRRFKGGVIRIPCDRIRVTVTKVEVGRG